MQGSAPCEEWREWPPEAHGVVTGVGLQLDWGLEMMRCQWYDDVVTIDCGLKQVGWHYGGRLAAVNEGEPKRREAERKVLPVPGGALCSGL